MPKLIWFMHFHKAGGTSVVELARRNGETFPPHHRNGNPHDSDGKAHHTWELSAAGLNAYVDEALLSGVSFVASEWGCPDPSVLAARDDVLSIVVLREPLDRIISNFRFDYLLGADPAPTVVDWVDHHSLQYARSNYYTRLLLGREWRSDGDPEDLVNQALERLRLFDVAVVLEDPTWLQMIASRAGWTNQAVHINTTARSWKVRLGSTKLALQRGRLDVAARAIRNAPPSPSSNDVQRLRTLNDLDIRLYNAVAERT